MIPAAEICVDGCYELPGDGDIGPISAVTMFFGENDLDCIYRLRVHHAMWRGSASTATTQALHR